MSSKLSMQTIIKTARATQYSFRQFSAASHIVNQKYYCQNIQSPHTSLHTFSRTRYELIDKRTVYRVSTLNNCVLRKYCTQNAAASTAKPNTPDKHKKQVPAQPVVTKGSVSKKKTSVKHLPKVGLYSYFVHGHIFMMFTFKTCTVVHM